MKKEKQEKEISWEMLILGIFIIYMIMATIWLGNIQRVNHNGSDARIEVAKEVVIEDEPMPGSPVVGARKEVSVEVIYSIGVIFILLGLRQDKIKEVIKISRITIEKRILKK